MTGDVHFKRLSSQFLSDNPFRLLNVGSAVPITQMRRLAARFSKSVSAGIDQEAALSEFFDTYCHDDIVSNVRRLTVDPVDRTAYRFMWPFSSAYVELLVEPEATFTGIDDVENRQLQFLREWIGALRSVHPENVSVALHYFESLCSRSDFDHRLKDLLVADGDVNPSDAAAIVDGAKELLATSILRTINIAATSLWSGGNCYEALRLAEASLGSQLKKNRKDSSLEALLDSILTMRSQLHDGMKDAADNKYEELAKLAQMAAYLKDSWRVLQEHFPAASSWSQEADDCMAALAIQMRTESRRLCRENRISEAHEVLRHAMSLTTSPALFVNLRDELHFLESVKADSAISARPNELIAISDPPSLRTVNGCGLMLYGRESAETGSPRFFSVLYFVIAFLPILPLARYLVEEPKKGTYIFHGKSRWTDNMRWHLGASVLGLLLFSFWIVSARPEDRGSSTSLSGEPQTTSTTLPGVVVDSETDSTDHVGESRAKELRFARLERERWSLSKRIDELQDQITSEAASIETKRSELIELKNQLEISSPDLYSQAEVDAYNDKVKEYEIRRRALNSTVGDYNKLVAQEKIAVERYNTVVGAINERN